jgi:hypothetical protein
MMISSKYKSLCLKQYKLIKIYLYILWELDTLEKLIQKELEDEEIKLVNDVNVRLKKEDEEECL